MAGRGCDQTPARASRVSECRLSVARATINPGGKCVTVGGQRINMCARSRGRRTGFQNARRAAERLNFKMATRDGGTYRGFYASTIILCNLYSIRRRLLDSVSIEV